MTLQRQFDLVHHGGIIDGGGHGEFHAVGQLLHGGAQDLAGAGLGQAVAPTSVCLKAATGPILSRTSATISFSISAWIAVTPAFSTRKPQRHLALQAVLGNADHRAFGHGRMGREHLLHAAGGEAMPATLMMSSVRPMMIEIAVRVFETGIGGVVVAR